LEARRRASRRSSQRAFQEAFGARTGGPLAAETTFSDPDERGKEEQDRLARQLDLVTVRLDALDSTYEQARTQLQECLALAGGCQTVYACGSDATRRIANQARFTRIYLDADDTIRTEPTTSFQLLLDPDPSNNKPHPKPTRSARRASVPPRTSCIMSRVRVRRVEWS